MSESGFSRHLTAQAVGVVDSSGVTRQRRPDNLTIDRRDALGDLMPVFIRRINKHVVMRIVGSKRAVLESWVAENVIPFYRECMSGGSP
jgi:hypothetical protein